METAQITNGHIKKWSRCPVSFKRILNAHAKYGTTTEAARRLGIKPHNVAYAVMRSAAKEGISKVGRISKKPSKAHAKARSAAQRGPATGVPTPPGSGRGARSPAAVRDALTYLG